MSTTVIASIGHCEAASTIVSVSAPLGSSTTKTRSMWLDRFDDARPAIAELGFDERFRRMWRYYLAYCEAGFNTGRISVQQWAFERGT